MSKKNNIKSSNTVIHADITKENLVQALVGAKEAAEKDKINKRIEAKANWKITLGLRDDLSGIKKYWNEFSCIMKLLAFPKKYQNKNEALGTRFLMTAFLSFVFGLSELFCICFAVYQIYIVLSNKANLSLIPVALCSLLLILFSRFFRMARLEAEDLSNKESLYLVFTAVVSFIAMVFTVASPK